MSRITEASCTSCQGTRCLHCDSFENVWRMNYILIRAASLLLEGVTLASFSAIRRI